jgi:putative hydrolase of the HAD superfamily
VTRLAAVLFDLDDTLFDQSTWLEGAWRGVAEAARPLGVPGEEFRRALVEIAAEGTARGGIIDRALVRVGRTDVAVGPLVDAFRSHRPATLPTFPGAGDLLCRLRGRLGLGLVTDGDPCIQRAKLEAIGLAGCFDVIVFSDELGREFRKPHAAPFRLALHGLGVDPSQAAFVGDHPVKDIDGARSVGMTTVRVRTGEYRSSEGEAPADSDVADLGSLSSRLPEILGGIGP